MWPTSHPSTNQSNRVLLIKWQRSLSLWQNWFLCWFLLHSADLTEKSAEACVLSRAGSHGVTTLFFFKALWRLSSWCWLQRHLWPKWQCFSWIKTVSHEHHHPLSKWLSTCQDMHLFLEEMKVITHFYFNQDNCFRNHVNKEMHLFFVR